MTALVSGVRQWFPNILQSRTPCLLPPPPHPLPLRRYSAYNTLNCEIVRVCHEPPPPRPLPLRRYFSWARKTPGYGPPRPTGPGAAAPAAPPIRSYAPEVGP